MPHQKAIFRKGKHSSDSTILWRHIVLQNVFPYKISSFWRRQKNHEQALHVLNVKPHRPFVVVIVLFLLLIPSSLFAVGLSAGIPRDIIWFSKEPFFDGDQVTIFTPLYNSSSYRFSGSVELRDGTATIGTQQFSLASDGASTVVAFPWKATEGEHVFSVLVTEGKFAFGGQSPVDLPISEKTTTVIKRSVGLKPKAPVQLPPEKDSVSGIVAMAEENILANLPAPFVSEAVPVLGKVESFRIKEATRADAAVSALQTAIAPEGISVGGESGWKTLFKGVKTADIVHTPWEYVKLFLALCYQFVTTNVYAFYIFLSYVLYRVVRFVISAVS
ncbi:MAG TPA: hypothetical protein VJB70_04660 [Candidatus Paceibacterota bacterium]